MRCSVGGDHSLAVTDPTLPSRICLASGVECSHRYVCDLWALQGAGYVGIISGDTIPETRLYDTDT